MGCTDHGHQVSPRAEARNHLEEVLDSVAVKVVAFNPLAKHGRNPEGGDPEVGEVWELADDPGQGAALESPFARLLPKVPLPHGLIVRGRVRRPLGDDVGTVEQRSCVSCPSEKRSGSKK